MNKKIVTILLAGYMAIIPVQVFGATRNHIPYISQTKIDQVTSTQVIIDNTNGDLKPGQYFTITLENAEFDLDEDGQVNMRSSYIDLGGSSKKSIYGTLKDGAPSIVSFSFHSKILGEEAKVIIDPEDSGISGGSYIYATTGKSQGASIGKIEAVTPVHFDRSLQVPPIVIKEQSEAAFRSAQMYNTSNEDLITFMPKSNLFKIRSSDSYHNITFVVHDGKGSSMRYELGRDPEVEFDYAKDKITFKKSNDDIFDTQGQIYTITIENMEVSLKDKDEKSDDMALVFGGLLLGDQTITLGQSSLEPLKLETSKEEMKPGTKQTIQFTLDEQHMNTLFKEGYINLGIYGEGKIESLSSLKFTLKDGVNTYNEREKNAFKVVLDPIGDRITIENYRRKDPKNVLKLEGELTVTVPDQVTKDIEFFVSEPSLSQSVKQTVLTATEEIIQPPAPEVPTVQFTLGQATYTLDGKDYPMDARAYVSVHDRIMVPLRYVAYALGVDPDDLKWDGPAQTVTLKGDKDMTINMKTGTMMVDGTPSGLSETRLIGGRTFVPVGEIGRAFGAEVSWDSDSRTATFN